MTDSTVNWLPGPLSLFQYSFCTLTIVFSPYTWIWCPHLCMLFTFYRVTLKHSQASAERGTNTPHAIWCYLERQNRARSNKAGESLTQRCQVALISLQKHDLPQLVLLFLSDVHKAFPGRTILLLPQMLCFKQDFF